MRWCDYCLRWLTSPRWHVGPDGGDQCDACLAVEWAVNVQGVLRECLGMAIEAVENPTSDPKAICAVIAARAEIALNGGRCMVEMVDAGRCPDQASPGNYEGGGHKPGDSASITAVKGAS